MTPAGASCRDCGAGDKESVEDGADYGKRAEVADCAEMGGIVLDKEVKDVVSVGARHAV